MKNSVKAVLYEESLTNDSSPIVTGLPPHTTLLCKLDRMERNVLNCVERGTDKVIGTLTNELEMRNVGGEAHQGRVILDQVSQSIVKLNERIDTIGTGGGALNSQQGGSVPAYEEGAVIEMTDPSTPTRSKRKMYCWDGKLRNIPKEVVVPKLNLCTLIKFWYLGSSEPKVPPFKHARATDFPGNNKMKIVLSQMKWLMKGVERSAQLEGINTKEIESVAEATDLYGKVSKHFSYDGAKRKRRHAHILWKTVYNAYIKNKCLLVGEVVSG